VKLLRKLGADMKGQRVYSSPGVSKGFTVLDVVKHEGHTNIAEKLTRYTSQCACCEKKASADVKLLACSRCKKTFYCSAQCQKLECSAD
jgi:hypothetical protein